MCLCGPIVSIQYSQFIIYFGRCKSSFTHRAVALLVDHVLRELYTRHKIDTLKFKRTSITHYIFLRIYTPRIQCGFNRFLVQFESLLFFFLSVFCVISLSRVHSFLAFDFWCKCVTCSETWTNKKRFFRTFGQQFSDRHSTDIVTTFVRCDNGREMMGL